MPEPAEAKYLDRIERVRAHIRDHLDAPLDLDALANVACLSRFHWTRVYHAMTGETPTETVRRLRLDRAARDLARGEGDIGKIALSAGYSSQAAFTRAFTAAFGQPPARFREAGPHAELIAATQENNAMAFPVELRKIPLRHAVGLLHKGPYNEIGHTFGSLFNLIGAARLTSEVRGAFGRYTDDPKVVAADDLRSHACAFVSRDIAVKAPLERFEAGGGSYAVLTYKGPYSAMQPAYDWLFGTWLPQSRLTPRDTPILEININTPMDTAPADLVTEICLPVEE